MLNSERDGRPAVLEPEAQATNSAVQLAQAFSEFIATSSRLEDSYRELQREVNGLGAELAERNKALKDSVNENELMRLSLQLIVDSMPCGVLVVDGKGSISIINPECSRLMGLNGAGGSRRHPLTLREIEERSGIHLALAADADTDTEQELRLRSDAGERWLHVRHRKTFPRGKDADGREQAILIVRDITGQKNAERDREAGRNAMALAEITTILAHEIRNPLASLELFAELIEQDGERRGEWISNLRAGIRSLAGTVNNVLAFHTSGALKLGPVNLGVLVDNAVQFIQPLAGQAKVQLRWQRPQSELVVMGNENALQQVMLNLLANALRHTPAEGVVSLTLRDGGDGIVLECADTGCGLREAQIASIFAPGFSGNGDTPGLGLAVCERIMTQHGGSIRAANGVECGARFVLEFKRSGTELAIA
ncbi:MAG TPA: ATP-binding protein [Acidobacteriaceae bacterium]